MKLPYLIPKDFNNKSFVFSLNTFGSPMTKASNRIIEKEEQKQNV